MREAFHVLRWFAFHTRCGLRLMGTTVAGAAIRTVLGLFAAAFAARSLLHRCRRRAGRDERQARRVLGVPANHPERVSGSDKAARSGDFPRWAAELEADGIDAGQIIDAHRRHL